MATKDNPGEIDYYERAEPDEPIWPLLGRDRHAAALIRLWAEMREREGEPAESVAEARQAASDFEEVARKRGAAVMTMDSVIMFATTLRKEKEDAAAAPQTDTPPADASAYALKEGEIVVPHRGKPAKLLKIFGPDADEKVRGQANVQFARSPGPITVPFASLRRAMPEELEVYRLEGGRL